MTAISYLQIQVGYLTSWSFPTAYLDTFKSWLRVLSFELLEFRIPVLVTPLIQFVAAALFVVMFISMDYRDLATFRNFAVHLYRQSRLTFFKKRRSISPEHCKQGEEDVFEVTACDTCKITHVKRILSRDNIAPDTSFSVTEPYDDSNTVFSRKSPQAAMEYAMNIKNKLRRSDAALESKLQDPKSANTKCKTCDEQLIPRYFADDYFGEDTEYSPFCTTHNCGLRLTMVPRGECRTACERFHTALTFDMKPSTKGPKWGDVIQVWQCAFPGCQHYICLDCGTERMSTLRSLYEKLNAQMPFIIVMVAMMLYVPVVKTTMMVILCHPVFQCAFTSCFERPDVFFSIMFAGSMSMMFFVGFLMPVQMMFAAFRRRELIRSDISINSSWDSLKSWISMRGYARWITGKSQNKEKKSSGKSAAEFQRFILLSDNMGLSTMTKIYAMFRPRYMVIGPIFQQSIKLGITLCCVLLETNSTEQLAFTGALEALNCLFILISQPFSSPGIQRVSAFGSMHQVGLITLSAFYRVALFDNDEDAQVIIAALMFVFSFSFILVILHTLYQLETHTAIAQLVRDTWKGFYPDEFEFQPVGCGVKFYVGPRSTRQYLGYPVIHGQNIVMKDDPTIGGIVAGTAGGPNCVLYWKRHATDIWEPCARTPEEFEAKYTCLQNCDSLEGVFTLFVPPDKKKKEVTQVEKTSEYGTSEV